MIISRTNRNFGLDLARAGAACMVLAVHLAGNLVLDDMGPFWFLAYLGVDIFFVLSGFLIGNILIQSIDPSTGRFGFRSLKIFYIRRWLRTVPLYYFVLLLNLAIGYILLQNTATFSWRYFFWMQNLFSRPPDFFGESWTLSIEEWCYLLYPMAIFLFLNSIPGRRRFPHVLLVCILLFLVAGNVLRSNLTQGTYWELNVVVCRMDAIGYGFLFAVLDNFFAGPAFRRYYRLIGLLGAGLLLCSIYLYLSQGSGLSYLLFYPGSGLALGGLIIYAKNAVFPLYPPVTRMIQWLSRISYSIYLNNLLVIYLVKEYLKVDPLLQVLVAVFLVLAFSALTYRVVELGFIRLRDRYFPAASAGRNYPVKRQIPAPGNIFSGS